MVYNPKLFIAIDHSEEKIAKDLIQRLPPETCGIKIGKELFTACGPKIVDWVHSKGFKVFLDLKYHDIPNTVEKACVIYTEATWIMIQTPLILYNMQICK